MNEDSLSSVHRELFEQFKTERAWTAMHRLYGYQKWLQINFSLTSSCLTKERCSPTIVHWKSLDTWPEDTDFQTQYVITPSVKNFHPYTNANKHLTSFIYARSVLLRDILYV
jgi:type II secretory pathway pseudopilin PulG